MSSESVFLKGVVEKVLFRNDETSFTICVIKVGRAQTVTVTGAFALVHPGEEVHFSGSWGFHPKFGRQFQARESKTTLPTHVLGIKKYLSSGLIKGIGPQFAKRLVDRFGEKTLEVIDTTPERLFEVGGIGKKRVEAIIAAWEEQRAISELMVFLQARGVSTAFAAKIYKAYGDQARSNIEENPYRLIDDIWGVGFKTADTLALKLGMDVHSHERVIAGIIYSIQETLQNGHLYISVSDLKQKVFDFLGLEHDDDGQKRVKRALRDLYDREKIKVVLHEENHYATLPQYYYSERGIASKIERLQNQPVARLCDTDSVYKKISIPDAQGFILNEDQQRGIMTCIQHKVSIITGGPGTGKTTLVKKLLEIFDASSLRIRLAAPTGRAAKRMFESTGRSAETLHRLLEFAPERMGFLRNEGNALDLDVLIVDEASMIDVFLMHALLRAIPEQARLILLGDIDQLPSVGAGNVLHDLIASEKVATIRLSQIFRQKGNSLIIVNAHRINNGEFPLTYQEHARRDFVLIKEPDPEGVFTHLKDLYEKKFVRLGVSPSDSIVLAPMNRGVAGTHRLNQELQRILNPKLSSDTAIMRFGTWYGVHDRVMQIRNNYDKFVFNGDIGMVVAIDHAETKIMIRFGERDLQYDFTELDELTLAYAVSIHRSQGSEFDVVIIPLFMQHYILLQRNLIYTAITRAKKLCILIGQTKALAMAIRNNKGVERITFLKDFLTGSIEE